MTSIQKRPGGKWRARYRDEAGKEHARHFGRKLDAQRWLDEVTTSLVTGAYVDPKAGTVTVRRFAADWESRQVVGAAQARVIDNALRVHVLPQLGDKAIKSVRRSDIQQLVKSLEGSLAPGTVRNVYDVVVKVFAAAVFDRLIASTPCERIALPRSTDNDVTPPTIEQVNALANGIDERYSAAVVMLAGSGLRVGELLGLKVSDVDFLRRTVKVARQQHQDGTVAAPKTASSARTVPLGAVVVDALAAHLAAYPSDEWLFTEDSGRAVPYWLWKRKWWAARPGFTTHDLRHFFASALIAGGASVKQVQDVLGHSSAVITLRIYAHMWPGDEDRTRSAIDASLDGLRTRCGHSTSDSGVIAGEGV